MRRPGPRLEGGLERLVGPPRALPERGVDPQLELQPPREAVGSSLRFLPAQPAELPWRRRWLARKVESTASCEARAAADDFCLADVSAIAPCRTVSSEAVPKVSGLGQNPLGRDEVDQV